MAKNNKSGRASAGHPGPYIREIVLDRLGLTVTQGAAAIGITRAAFSTFLNGRASLSADMALRIDKAFALSMERLMHMQCDFDITVARAREDEIKVRRFLPTPAPGPEDQPELFDLAGER